jgi:hypothetical protein
VRKKRLSVWPYYAYALFFGVLGAVLLFNNLGPEFPPEKSLQKVSGNIHKLFLIDDLSGERTSIMKPMNSIHFTLEEVEGEFRYPSSWPGYNMIWRQLSFHVDVWVEKSAMGKAEPLVVYKLEQTVPENWVVEPFNVSYSEIADSQGHSERSYLYTGAGLLAASGGFVLVAILVRIWNRRQSKPSPG